MAAKDNKAAVLRFYEEVINGTDLDAIDELLTPDGVDHTFGSQSAKEAKQFFGMLYQAFPDLRVEVNDVIAEGPGGRPGDLLGHPRGRVCRHPGHRPADPDQRGGLLPDAGRQAGRALGRTGHGQPAPAAWRPARTGRVRLAAVAAEETAGFLVPVGPHKSMGRAATTGTNMASRRSRSATSASSYRCP